MASMLRCVTVGDGAVGKTSMLLSYSQGGFPDEYVPTILDQYAANITVSGIPYILELVDTAGQEDYDRLRPLSYNKANIFLVCFSVVVPSSYNNVKETWIPELHEIKAKVPFLLALGTGNRFCQFGVPWNLPVAIRSDSLEEFCARRDEYLSQRLYAELENEATEFDFGNKLFTDRIVSEKIVYASLLTSERQSVAIQYNLLVGTQIDLRDDPKVLQELHSRKQKPISKETGQRIAKKIGAAGYKECSALTMVGIKDVFDESICIMLNPSINDPPKHCCAVS